MSTIATVVTYAWVMYSRVAKGDVDTPLKLVTHIILTYQWSMSMNLWTLAYGLLISVYGTLVDTLRSILKRGDDDNYRAWSAGDFQVSQR